jgi:hypothetical protein
MNESSVTTDRRVSTLASAIFLTWLGGWSCRTGSAPQFGAACPMSKCPLIGRIGCSLGCELPPVQ